MVLTIKHYKCSRVSWWWSYMVVNTNRSLYQLVWSESWPSSSSSSATSATSASEATSSSEATSTSKTASASIAANSGNICTLGLNTQFPVSEHRPVQRLYGPVDRFYVGKFQVRVSFGLTSEFVCQNCHPVHHPSTGEMLLQF